METVAEIAKIRTIMAGWRAEGRSIALVPTMGALHAGHLSLVAEARRRADICIASIFVNPTQFAPGEDFDRYPRQLATDSTLLRDAGCALLFAPTADIVYPPGFATEIHVGSVAEPLEGQHRPDHFTGVATIVAKLLLMTLPDHALFGEKDWQQLAVIRRMVQDLHIPVEIHGCPTLRDTDGLALSSRNAYLSAEERAAASALPRALESARARILAGEPVAAALADAGNALLAAGFASVDYLALADAGSMQLLDVPDRPARLLVAARLGTTRLIDNIAVEPRA